MIVCNSRCVWSVTKSNLWILAVPLRCWTTVQSNTSKRHEFKNHSFFFFFPQHHGQLARVRYSSAEANKRTYRLVAMVCLDFILLVFILECTHVGIRFNYIYSPCCLPPLSWIGGLHLHHVYTSLFSTTFSMKARAQSMPFTRCLPYTWWYIRLPFNLRLNTLKIDSTDHCHRVMDWDEVYWLALVWMLWQVVFDGWEPFRPCTALASCSWVKPLQRLVSGWASVCHIYPCSTSRLLLAQVFMLSIPPQLAVAWFPENEINVATSIAVSANNLGIAAGCALTPLIVKQATRATDIPHLLLIQVCDTFGLKHTCSFSWLTSLSCAWLFCCWFGFPFRNHRPTGRGIYMVMLLFYKCIANSLSTTAWSMKSIQQTNQVGYGKRKNSSTCWDHTVSSWERNVPSSPY